MTTTMTFRAMMARSTHFEKRGGLGSELSGSKESKREPKRSSEDLTEDDGDDDGGGRRNGGGGGGGSDCGGGDKDDGPAEVFSPEHLVRGLDEGSVARNLAWLDGNRK